MMCVCIQSPLLVVLSSRFYTSYFISYLFSCLGLGLSISLFFSNNKGCLNGFICGFVVSVAFFSAHPCDCLFSSGGVLFAGFPVSAGECDWQISALASMNSEARMFTLSMAVAAPNRLHLTSIL